MDIFEHEQQIFDDAVKRAAKAGVNIVTEEYVALTKHYGKLLKQLRRATKFADRTTIGLHESNLDLEDKVHYDVLTGIYNRRYMEESLTRIVKSAARFGSCVSLLILDVDYFKKYNDFYGHGLGDECLKAVASALSKALMRADDFVARYGGEEFVIVLPGTEAAGADRVGKALLECVQALRIPHEKSDVADHVTISVGGTTVYPNRGDKFTDYIRVSDEALYMSKQNGRNRYTYKAYTQTTKEGKV